MKSRKKRGTLWFVEGQPWTYRHPFEQGGKWRARRRNRATGAVEKVTLNSKTLTAARSEIQAMADEERRFAPATAAPVGDSPSTVRGALDAWLQTLDVRPATMATYRLDAALYGRLLGEERPMRSLAYADVEALFSGPWRDLAGRTKIKHRALLARFFGWALKHKLAAANYAEMVEVQKRWSKESSDAAQETGQALTLEEARKLLAACREKRTIAYKRLRKGQEERITAELEPPGYLWWSLFIALRTGLRLSNIVGSDEKPGLLWRHVDLKARELRIPPEQMKNDRELHVPLHPELSEVLEASLRARDAVPLPDERIVQGLVTGGEIKKGFRAAVARAGLGDRALRLHDLRHTFLSWLGAHCTHATMQVLAGHKARSVTDRYAKHQEMSTLRAGLEALPWIYPPGTLSIPAFPRA